MPQLSTEWDMILRPYTGIRHFGKTKEKDKTKEKANNAASDAHKIGTEVILPAKILKNLGGYIFKYTKRKPGGPFGTARLLLYQNYGAMGRKP